MIYAITTNEIVNVFGKVANNTKKVAKSVEQFATFNIKVLMTNNFFATLDVKFANDDVKVAINDMKNENDKIEVTASPRTKSSTFAIRTKPTHKPKIAKELAFYQPT